MVEREKAGQGEEFELANWRVPALKEESHQRVKDYREGRSTVRDGDLMSRVEAEVESWLSLRTRWNFGGFRAADSGFTTISGHWCRPSGRMRGSIAAPAPQTPRFETGSSHRPAEVTRS